MINNNISSVIASHFLATNSNNYLPTATNQKPTIYRNLYENTGPGDADPVLSQHGLPVK